MACAAHAQRSSPCPYSHTSVAVSELPATMGFRFSMPVWIDTIDKGKGGTGGILSTFFSGEEGAGRGSLPLGSNPFYLILFSLLLHFPSTWFFFLHCSVYQQQLLGVVVNLDQGPSWVWLAGRQAVSFRTIPFCFFVGFLFFSAHPSPFRLTPFCSSCQAGSLSDLSVFTFAFWVSFWELCLEMDGVDTRPGLDFPAWEA